MARHMPVAVVSAHSSQTSQRALVDVLLLEPLAEKQGRRHLHCVNARHTGGVNE
jgi:hypothetical protein